MSQQHQQRILEFTLSSDLLEFLVAADSGQQLPTTLIVCSTRDEFLSQLAPAFITNPAADETGTPDAEPGRQDESLNAAAGPSAQATSLRHMLQPTLRMLAATKSITLAFCPTIDSLRAYLSSHAAAAAAAAIISAQEPRADQKPSSGALNIATSITILNLVQLHHGTSEFSVQGLSRTLALAVSSCAAAAVVVARTHRPGGETCFQLVECSDVHDLENPHRGSKLWDVKVPLLSGSVRLGGEGASWAGGKSIAVRRVVGRWFTFEPTMGEGTLVDIEERGIGVRSGATMGKEKGVAASEGEEEDEMLV